MENVYVHSSPALCYPANDYLQLNVILSCRNIPNRDFITVNKFYSLSSHYAVCANCKESPETNNKWFKWIRDTGASIHVTNDIDDFIEYKMIAPILVSTAKKAQGGYRDF